MERLTASRTSLSGCPANPPTATAPAGPDVSTPAQLGCPGRGPPGGGGLDLGRRSRRGSSRRWRRPSPAPAGPSRKPTGCPLELPRRSAGPRRTRPAPSSRRRRPPRSAATFRASTSRPLRDQPVLPGAKPAPGGAAPRGTPWSTAVPVLLIRTSAARPRSSDANPGTRWTRPVPSSRMIWRSSSRATTNSPARVRPPVSNASSSARSGAPPVAAAQQQPGPHRGVHRGHEQQAQVEACEQRSGNTPGVGHDAALPRPCAETTFEEGRRLSA